MLLISENDIRLLKEVDINGQPAGDADNADNEDYTAEPVNAAGADNTEEAETTGTDSETNTDDNDVDYTADGNENDPSSNEDGGGEDMDYTANNSEEGEDGSNRDENSDGSTSSAGDGQVTADEGRGLEDELFKDLTRDQIDLKHKELKNNFLELYDSTSNIIDRVNQIPSDDSLVSTISFVSKKLSDLRTMVADYMNNVYSTKSYMENAINYNKFLATFKGINDILEEVNKELNKNG